MGGGLSSEFTRRRLLLAPVIAAHAALLLWVAADRASPAPERLGAELAVFDLPDTPAPAKPVAKTALSKMPTISPPARAAPLILAVPPLVTGLPPPAAPSTATASDCDLTDMVQAALRASLAAHAALSALPQEAHSVANAVMLWNGRWIDGATSRDALTPVRAVVGGVVMGASAECRQAIQAGPRLVTVAGPPDMVLAIGTGRWRWGDLASQDDRVGKAGSTDVTEPTPSTS